MRRVNLLAALLACLAGCGRGQSAEEMRGRVSMGMTREEVVEALGEPDQATESDSVILGERNRQEFLHYQRDRLLQVWIQDGRVTSITLF